GFFNGLGIRPVAGRFIANDDDRTESPAVAVVSAAFGQRHFGDVANAAGQTILVNNVPFTVIVVAPTGFFDVDPSTASDPYFPVHAGVAIEAIDPFGAKPSWYQDEHLYWIEVMARLRPGVSRAQVQAALAPQFHRWVESTVTEEQERATLPTLVIQ